MARPPVLHISSPAIAQLKHWLDQPSSAAEPELLICNLPSWIASAEIKTLDGKPAIVITLMARNESVSPPVTLEPSGFAVLLILTALRATGMVDHREKGGRPYVKVFADADRSAGISLRRILSGTSEGEIATVVADPLDLRACVTGFAKGSRRDERDQSDAYAEALSRFGPDTPPTLGFRSRSDYQGLIARAFERHWADHEDVSSLADAAQ